MAIAIFFIFITSCILISLEHKLHINKAAIAMFSCILSWLLIIYGEKSLLITHYSDFYIFLNQRPITHTLLREYISHNIFMNYVATAAGIILFLLGTMSIVEVLDSNNCFAFLRKTCISRNPLKVLWTISILTFALSANLDNLTTSCIMLSIMHTIYADTKVRFIIGSTIILAANLGGACTVIGDTTSLLLWEKGLITPSHYFSILIIPCLCALVITTSLVQRTLPEHIRLTFNAEGIYREDSNRLSHFKRYSLFIIGIGGLWFIPTFHRITSLPIFAGALCVLGIVWILHELYNRKFINSDIMINVRRPIALQYQTLQNILFFLGIILMVAALKEVGILEKINEHLPTRNVYVLGGFNAFISAFINNTTTSIYNIYSFSEDIRPQFHVNGLFWPILSYVSAWGGTLLLIGSLSGFALWNMEGITLKWYIRHFLPKVFLGGLCGFMILLLITIML